MPRLRPGWVPFVHRLAMTMSAEGLLLGCSCGWVRVCPDLGDESITQLLVEAKREHSWWQL